MTRVLLLLALLVGAWFAYRTLAGGPAGAATRDSQPSLHDLEALSHRLPAAAPEGAPPAADEAPKASPPHPRLAELDQALKKGDRKGAAAAVLALAPAHAGDPAFRTLAARSVRQALAAGDPEGAGSLATALLDRWTSGPIAWPESGPEWDEWRGLLRETMNGLVFNPGVAWRSRIYEVASNDSLDRIRKRIRAKDGVSVESGFLAAVNRVSPTRLQTGQKLRVPVGAMKVIVEKHSFTLKLFLDEVLIRIYRVGLGKDGCTPSTTFTVELKEANPIWWPAGGRAVPHGHPDNPLGDHFIKLRSDVYQGFGIHGTRVEDRPTIGTSSSEGCIRMYAEDMAELFAFLPVGTEVVVR